MNVLDELKAVVDPLNAARDAVRERIDTASDVLAKLKIGVRVRVHLDKNDLAFDRKGDTWGLFVIVKTKDNREAKIPLSEASVEDRCMAAANLDGLLTEILYAAQHELDRIKRAAEQVEAFIRKIAPAQETEP